MKLFSTATGGGSPPRAERLDAAAKATGREAYAADFYSPEMLWAGALRAGVAHARLRGVDLTQAREVPGVVAVLTAADVTGSNRQGVVRCDQPVLVDEVVRHAGDPLALVVATSREALAQGLAALRPDLEPLPAVFDPEAALAPDAPLLLPDHPGGNLLLSGEVTKGRGAAALAQCAVVGEHQVDLPRQEHAYLETEAGWARADEAGLTICVSTQTPFRDRDEVARALGLEPERVRIMAPAPGGAFGGKDGVGIQSLLGLAALACPGRPIKMQLSREESFLSSPKRHPARARCRLGANARGRLVAVDTELTYDTGAYDHLGGVVMTLGLEHAGGAYAVEHARLRSRAVYTNNPVGGAFRGFGVTQALATVELAMEALARELGMCPLELRRLNAVPPGGSLAAGHVPGGSNHLAACLDAIAGHELWRGRQDWKAAAGPRRLRGVGVSSALHAMGYGPVVPDVAEAKLELTLTGGMVLYSGVVDMGQGNASLCARLAAEALGQDPASVDLVLPDTSRTLNSGSSSASRTSFTFGQAALGAAEKLRAEIVTAAAGLLHAPPGELELVPGRALHRASGREVGLDRVAAAMAEERRRAVYRYQAPTSNQRPSDDRTLALHGLPHEIFSFGAMLAGVELDTLTGRVMVVRLVMACDVGKVLSPLMLAQQAHGGAAQGLGYALLEDMPTRQGIIETPDLATYLIPTALDLPDMELIAVDGFEPLGPAGLKGAGELPVDLPLPAVAAAVANACGWLPKRFPIQPSEVLSALEGNR